MTGLHELIARLAHGAETNLDEWKYALVERLGLVDKVSILVYNGFGNDRELFLRGRVLEDQGITSALETDDLWDNLVNTYRRLASDEIPNARLVARYQGLEVPIQANEEGYFEVTMPVSSPLPPGELWARVEFELEDPRQDPPVRAVGSALVAPTSSSYIVISDIDDTVLVSNATDLIRMARNVFLSNARTRLPFPGVAAFYRALFAGPDGNNHNPLFYVSSSPWNLYDLLTDFFHLQDIPFGPVLFLRDWGVTESEVLPLDNRKHKTRYIRRMLDFYPDLPFILIGDSGQQDPEIYTEIVADYGKRILATYIRNVESSLHRSEEIKELAKKVIEAGSDLVLADDTLALGEHAVEKGWIQASFLPEIRGEKLEDEEPQGPIERLQAGKADAPTTVIEAGTEKKAEQASEAIDQGAIETIIQEEGEQGEKKPPTVIIEGDQNKAGPDDKT